MSRMQRKFLLVSAAVHSLLLTLLIVGPAFMPKRPSPLVDLPVLRVIPSELILAAAFGGGAQEPAVLPSPPDATPPEPERPVRRPEPERPVQRSRETPTRPPLTKPDPVPEKPVPAPEVRKPEPKPAIKVAEVLKRRGTDDAQAARERALAEERRRQEAEAKAVKNKVASIVGDMQKHLSRSTEIVISGTGGRAFANYSQAVKSIYDQNWIAPKTLSNDHAVVQVEIVVNHDGRILEDGILKRSGIRSLDDSVQAALDRVRVKGLPPFPAELKAQGELQKTFRINFDLRSKLQLG